MREKAAHGKAPDGTKLWSLVFALDLSGSLMYLGPTL